MGLVNANGDPMKPSDEILANLVVQNLMMEFQDQVLSIVVADCLRRMDENARDILLKSFSEQRKNTYSNLSDPRIKMSPVGQILEQCNNKENVLELALKALSDNVKKLYFN